MKKFIALLALAVMFIQGGMRAEAAEPTSYGNFGIKIANGEVTITGLVDPDISTDIDLVIPGEVNGYKVTAIANKAFQGNVNIKSVKFNEGLKIIGYSAFQDCTNLTGDIELPSTLEEVSARYGNEGAFQNTNVGSVKVKTGTAQLKLGQYAFYNCSSLKSVALSGRESLIGSNAFAACANLETVSIPGGTVSKEIGGNAFTGTAIKTIDIPGTVTSIGSGAFMNCRSLTTLSLHEGLTKIGYSAFKDCIYLTGQLTIPASVQEIEGRYNDEGAFQNTALTQIEFMDGKENLKIGNCAFAECRTLEKVSFPKRLAGIDSYGFSNDSALSSISFPEGTVSFTIGNGAFQATAVTAVSLPKTVSVIGSNAFQACTALTSVTLSEGLTKIGYGAFGNCENLTGKITIPSTVKEIQGRYADDGAFMNTKITEVEVVDGNESLSIGGQAFSKCPELGKVTLPGRVTSVGNYAFAEDAKLKDLTITSGNYGQTIGAQAFYGAAIEELIVPEKVSVIGDQAFYGCKSLMKLTLNEGLSQIGYGAFGACEKLTGELVIPSTVEKINSRYDKDGAFYGTAITSLLVKDGNLALTIGNYTFVNCMQLGKADLSNRLSSLGNNAFQGDNSLVWARMKSGKYDLSIANGAFSNTTNLQVIVLPKRLKSIGSGNFEQSSMLTDVHYDGSENEYASISVSEKNNTYYFLAAMHYNSAGPDPMPEVVGYTGWKEVDGKYYWYEKGVLQGFDANNPEYRGKEIYDPGSDAWYWLDNVQNGAMAVSKDVYQESAAGEYADRPDGTGKWVRYDTSGHMVKGFDTNDNGTYYFDMQYGAMVKGLRVINDKVYYFDPNTGIMQTGMVNINGTEYAFDKDGVALNNQWCIGEDGKQYWYENGIRQGYDPNNAEYRGKEIFDPESNAWYWLDNVQGGAKAVSKDVYQESSGGKWVRYNDQGGMIKGWSVQDGNRYYFDLTTGAMYKGSCEIDGQSYYFNEDTGILQ